MKIQSFTISLFDEQMYIVWSEHGGDALLVDPGLMNDNEQQRVAQFVETNELTVSRVLLTHGHIDHIASAEWARQRWSARIIGHHADKYLFKSLPLQAGYFGMKMNIAPLSIDEEVSDGDILDVCGEPLHVLNTPGHSPGSVVFHAPESGLALTGDTLFAMSIGRTDLPGGNLSQMMDSLRTIATTLPPETVLYPGHGPQTTLQREIDANPYMKFLKP